MTLPGKAVSELVIIVMMHQFNIRSVSLFVCPVYVIDYIKSFSVH